MLEAVDPRHEPVLRSLAVDQAGAYAEEVRLLRRKVAALEAALAEAHAARLSDHGACQHAPAQVDPLAPATSYAPASSEFVAPLAPAVVPVTAANQRALSQPVEPAGPRVVATLETESPAACSAEAAVAATNGATASFAAAWGEGPATFEERFAAKAFFQVGTVDEASREWLLSADRD
jgi:hypothetical protein